MARLAVRHVRYEDFIALISGGVGEIANFRTVIDKLVVEMGTLCHHNLLIDLRNAMVSPVPESALSEALTYMHDLGFGVQNKVAVLSSIDDTIRTERMQTAINIGTLLGMDVEHFHDYEQALEWLNGDKH